MEEKNELNRKKYYIVSEFCVSIIFSIIYAMMLYFEYNEMKGSPNSLTRTFNKISLLGLLGLGLFIVMLDIISIYKFLKLKTKGKTGFFINEKFEKIFSKTAIIIGGMGLLVYSFFNQ